MILNSIKSLLVPDKFKAKAVESKPKKITPRVKKTESAKIKPVLAVCLVLSI